jgi:hypothetical protein
MAADLMATKKLIPDLPTWVQCFAMYMAAVATKQPEREREREYTRALSISFVQCKASMS